MESLSSVQEIEEAIRQLSPDEFAQLTHWIQELDQERWDRRIDADAAAGRLDFLFEEAARNKRNGLLKTWPPSS